MIKGILQKSDPRVGQMFSGRFIKGGMDLVGAFEFNQEIRRYTYDGVKLFGVTTVLEHHGHIKKGFYPPDAAVKGTRFHLACDEFDLSGEVPEVLSDDFTAPRVKAYSQFLSDTKSKPLLLESPVTDSICVGVVDRVVDWGGRLAVIDLKSGAPAPWHRYQTSAYAHLVSHYYGINVDLWGALHCDRNGRYRWSKHGDVTDPGAWETVKDFMQMEIGFSKEVGP